jgi:hypothetical protein
MVRGESTSYRVAERCHVNENQEPAYDEKLPRIPGTFQYRLLSQRSEESIPDLANLDHLWVREHFTRLARFALLQAQVAVVRWKAPALDVEHMLWGLLIVLPTEALAPGGPTNQILRSRLESLMVPGQTQRLEAIVVTDAVLQVIVHAEQEAHERTYDLIGTGPLLLGLTKEDYGPPTRILADNGITYASLRAELSPDAFTM